MKIELKHIKGIKIHQMPIEIDLIGHLIYYEGPLMSVYCDQDRNAYILDWVEKDETKNRWLLYQIEKYMLADYIFGKATHFQLINNPVNDLIYVLDKDRQGNIENCIICTSRGLPYDYLPANYLKFEPEDAQNLETVVQYFDLSNSINIESDKDVFDILEEADKTDEELINLHIKSSTRNVGYGKINSAVLGKVLSSYNNLTEETALSLFDHNGKLPKEERPRRRKGELRDIKKLAGLEFVYARAASFSVFLRPVSQRTNLFDAQTSSEKIASKVFELFEASTSPANLGKIKSSLSESMLNSYNQFLKNIDDCNISINLQYANPNNRVVLKNELSPIKVKRILENLSKLEFENKFEITEQGKFIALDITTFAFKFQTADDDVYSGKFSSELREYVYDYNLKNEYKVLISVDQSKISGKKTISEKDTMLRCYKIEELPPFNLPISKPKLLD
ncbi:MAG: hypothetical protein WC044_06075 [Crocinitomicaceae bacterium]